MSNPIPEKAQAILNERFGCDQLLSLATLDGDWPAVRTVNGYYEDGCFFVITYGLSNKMKQIEKNPHVALSGEWFTAQGIGENLGWFNREENADYARKHREVFASWIDNGHNDFSDPNTCILRIRLTKAVLFSHGTRYDLDFTAK